jgi:hypothetical protein
MSKGGDKVTIGYWYRMSAHLALCHRAHSVHRIKAGDKIAWTATTEAGVQTSQEILIDAPELFGGEQREGGIIGPVDIIMGSGAEPVNTYLQSVLPTANTGGDPLLPLSQLNEGFVPAFRHITSIVLKQPRVMANNPNLRPWNVEVFFQPSKDWYTATERPGTDYGVNPAHIVRECLTNPWWGLGYSPLDLDDDSFRAAALLLFN